MSGLPDEHGRLQILDIHIEKIRDNKKLAPDVHMEELAANTKNFSGAELEGLIRAATSTAMNRLIKVRWCTRAISWCQTAGVRQKYVVVRYLC